MYNSVDVKLVLTYVSNSPCIGAGINNGTRPIRGIENSLWVDDDNKVPMFLFPKVKFGDDTK